MCENLRGIGTRGRVEREERGKERAAGGGEVGKLAAKDRAVHARVGGETERTGVGKALVARPGGFGRKAEEFEDLRHKSY